MYICIYIYIHIYMYIYVRMLTYAAVLCVSYADVCHRAMCVFVPHLSTCSAATSAAATRLLVYVALSY